MVSVLIYWAVRAKHDKGKAIMDSELIEKKIGTYLRKLRENKSLTQSNLALQADLSLRHYQDIEYGLRRSRIDTLQKVLSIYKINIFDFLHSHVIDEFYKTGSEVLYSFLDQEDFTVCRLDNNGVYTYLSNHGPAVIKDKSVTDLMGKGKMWDYLQSPIERLFLESIFSLVLKIKPTPFPWKGNLARSDGEVIPIVAFWRYVQDDKGSILEIVAFKS